MKIEWAIDLRRYRASMTAQLPSSDQAPGTPTRTRPWLWLVLGGFVVVALLAALGAFLLRPTTEDRAVTYCQDKVVAPKLTEPKTAEFMDMTVAHGDGTDLYLVSGGVNHGNGSGGVVAEEFECDLRLEGETWVLIGHKIT
jgi:hypothetical protein